MTALTLGGCGEPHDMSIEDSCVEYLALKPESGQIETVLPDVRAAASQWHKAVSEPALVWLNSLDDMEAVTAAGDDVVGEAFNANERVFALCGGEYAPKY